MSKITIGRKSGLNMSASPFKILVDGKQVEEIANGEIITLDVPLVAKELTVKVKNYTSKPVTIKDQTSYLIRQNIVTSIAYFGFIIFFISYISLKYLLNYDTAILLYAMLPCMLISIYFMTFGRKKVIQVEEKIA